MSLNLEWDENTSADLMAWAASESVEAVRDQREGDVLDIFRAVTWICELDAMAEDRRQEKAWYWMKLKLNYISRFLSSRRHGDLDDEARKSALSDLILLGRFSQMNDFLKLLSGRVFLGEVEPEWLLPEPFDP